MTVILVIVLVYAAVALVYWLLAAAALWRTMRRVPELAALQPAEPDVWPSVSVIVPACDEADKLGPAVETLLAQDYPDLELVLVDERSTDGTGAIIDAAAACDDRVKALHITELPHGWLGKVHALDQGFRASHGRFVLFTDADVHFEPRALRQAVAFCLERELDHLTAFPGLWPTWLVLDAAIALFIRQFVMIIRPWAVPDPDSKAFLGIGAFNLVRREAFEATEGFEWLRLEVGDDGGLGLMMKRSGARCGVVTAMGLVGLHWYRTLGEAARGAEKSFATASTFSLPRAIVTAVVTVLLELSPLLCALPLAFRPLQLWCVLVGAVAVGAAYLLTAGLLGRWGRGKYLTALASCLSVPLVAYAVVRAAVLGVRRGGLMWRETVYPTEQLRAGRRLTIP